MNRISIDSWRQVLLEPYSIDWIVQCTTRRWLGQDQSVRADIRNCVGVRGSIATDASQVVEFINLDINPNFRFDFKVKNVHTQKSLQSVG